MQMLGGRGGGGSAGFSSAGNNESRAPAVAEGPADFDDDIPF
jgi:hypothetical protein